MDPESIKNETKDDNLKNISLDTNLLNVLALPEFKPKTRKLKLISAKIRKAILSDTCANSGIRTLQGLKKYVEENGWLSSYKYKHWARFGHMGRSSVEYFNKVMEKYGIEPFEPIYEINTGKNQRIRRKELSLSTSIPEFLEISELNYEPGVKKVEKASIKKGLREAKESLGIETLEDLKKYVEENGWSYRFKYICRSRFWGLGKKSVEYFNQIMAKYGIEPFAPYIKDEELQLNNIQK